MTHGDVAHMIECTANVTAARAVLDKFSFNKTESDKKHYLLSLFEEDPKVVEGLDNKSAVDTILSRHLCA